jgi:lysophospholipase L1-like esterase
MLTGILVCVAMAGPVLSAASGITSPNLSRNDMQATGANAAGPIVVHGASYAGGWKPSLPRIPVVNTGVSGQQSFQMLERFERDVVVARPRAVILWGFINDIFRASPGDLENGKTSQRIRQSFSRMIALSRRHGIEPVLVTEVTVRPPDTWRETIASWIGTLRGRQSYQDRINQRVVETNRWLTEVAQRENLLLLDFQRTLAEPDSAYRRREFTSDDGSHITTAGYEALTEYAKPILEQRFSR